MIGYGDQGFHIWLLLNKKCYILICAEAFALKQTKESIPSMCVCGCHACVLACACAYVCVFFVCICGCACVRVCV